MSAMHAMALPEEDPDSRAAAVCRAHGRAARRRPARRQAPAGWTVHDQVPAGRPLSSQTLAGALAHTQAAASAPGHTEAAPSQAARSQAAPSQAAPSQAARSQATPGQAAPSPAARGRTADAPLRLTRRGRVVVAVASALLMAVISLIAAGAVQATSHPLPPRAAQQNLTRVVVRPGQSLWSIAESADPHADTRLVIQQITELNGLTGETIASGQQLWVPRG